MKHSNVLERLSAKYECVRGIFLPIFIYIYKKKLNRSDIDVELMSSLQSPFWFIRNEFGKTRVTASFTVNSLNHAFMDILRYKFPTLLRIQCRLLRFPNGNVTYSVAFPSSSCFVGLKCSRPPHCLQCFLNSFQYIPLKIALQHSKAPSD